MPPYNLFEQEGTEGRENLGFVCDSVTVEFVRKNRKSRPAESQSFGSNWSISCGTGQQANLSAKLRSVDSVNQPLDADMEPC